jgi:hypothetical protein
MRRYALLLLAGVAALSSSASDLGAQGSPVDTTLRVAFGGFVDSYYAYDFGRPRELDRAFTTQPARHNEFNINLAHVEAVVSGGRLRGRLALQAGTSVQSNYAAEPTKGTVSGPEVARFIQEAYAGYQVIPSLWIDAGVFFSNMGMESWISSQNSTYTRSLVADYSPYYSSGVRATWQATPLLSVRVDVINGWQNISETNSEKAVGLRLDYSPGPGTTVSYYNYAGNETEGRLRLFNGVGVTASLTDRLGVLVQADVGTQEAPPGASGWSTWYGGVVAGRYRLTPAAALSARIERFADEDQVLIATGTGTQGFQVNGGSIGFDVTPRPRLMWRTELRGYESRDPLFADREDTSKYDAFVVSAMSVAF